MAQTKEIGNENKDIETAILKINSRIEQLKIQFNLYFSGEIKIPPDKERETIDAQIKKLLFSGVKGPRLSLLLQNLSNSFSLYNNMWLKRLNQLETGALIRESPKKKMSYGPSPTEKVNKTNGGLKVDLHNEESFNALFNEYCRITQIKSGNGQKEKVIGLIKSKMAAANLSDANVSLSINEGKLKIKMTR
jgi:hypothetical protein